jgi:hypothetical protein
MPTVKTTAQACACGVCGSPYTVPYGVYPRCAQHWDCLTRDERRAVLMLADRLREIYGDH